MIKFRTGGIGDLIGIGFTHKEIEKLKEGFPTLIEKKDLGQDFDILIFAERDEKTILKKLRDKGFLSSDDCELFIKRMKTNA